MEYTVQFPVALTLGVMEMEDGTYTHTLHFLRSDDPKEDEDLSIDHGQYACWDADALFEQGRLALYGYTAPSGGGSPITISVPQHLIRSLVTEAV